MESEHGLISSLLEWAGRRVDGARLAEAVAEGLGGAQIPSVPFTSGSPQGDMDVSFFIILLCPWFQKFDDSCLMKFYFNLTSATIFDRNVGLISPTEHFSS
jgi:hypothetical protein